MDEYRKRIDNLITKSDGEVALNGSTTHAAMVIERMLARASFGVRILTRYLDPLIYEDEQLQRSALDCLASGKKLQILVEEVPMPDQSENTFLKRLGQSGNLEIRQVPDELKDPIEMNFSLMDDRGFRIEKDETGSTAVVSFGNEKMNFRLRNLFDAVWEQSNSITSKS